MDRDLEDLKKKFKYLVQDFESLKSDFDSLEIPEVEDLTEIKNTVEFLERQVKHINDRRKVMDTNTDDVLLEVHHIRRLLKKHGLWEEPPSENTLKF